jgi:hypothetical protein
LIVKPLAFLGREVWYEINDMLKSFNAEWVSAGNESRWIIHKRSQK